MVKFSLYQSIAIRRRGFFRFALKFPVSSPNFTLCALGFFREIHSTQTKRVSFLLIRTTHMLSRFFVLWIKCFMNSINSSFSREFNETTQKSSSEKIRSNYSFCLFSSSKHTHTHTQTNMNEIGYDLDRTSSKGKMNANSHGCLWFCGVSMLYDWRRAYSLVLNRFCGFSNSIAFQSNFEIAERRAPILLNKLIVWERPQRS